MYSRFALVYFVTRNNNKKLSTQSEPGNIIQLHDKFSLALGRLVCLPCLPLPALPLPLSGGSSLPFCASLPFRASLTFRGGFRLGTCVRIWDYAKEAGEDAVRAEDKVAKCYFSAPVQSRRIKNLV